MIKNNTFNFGYDVVDRRARQTPQDVAVVYTDRHGATLAITCDELRHHSDIAAAYMQRIGVGNQTRVLLLGLERRFELALTVTALMKLGATAVIGTDIDPVMLCNTCEIYVVIGYVEAPQMAAIMTLDKLRTVELRIAVGTPVPHGWLDFHTGVRAAKIFRRPEILPTATDTALIVGTPSRYAAYPYSYFNNPTGDSPIDAFVCSQVSGGFWETAE
ncbi:MAG: AMP-binding protein [Prevotellaceae bacterium]|jgi:acetyl-CoA synthetase|nr:AMP-binding protein [Prevotellaceae bacterium]